MILNTSNAANYFSVKVQTQSNDILHIYSVYIDLPCFLHVICKLMNWMDTLFDQLLDMTIPCLSMQMQDFSILILLLSIFMPTQYIFY